MKKKILLFLLLFIPFMINAEEKCTIVSGNGKDIGSEIACGTEHFYIIEDKEDSVRMLAKYNLDIGYEYNKVTVTNARYEEIKELCSGASSCSLIFEEPEFVGYSYVHQNFSNEDNTYTYMIYRVIESNEIKQSSKAIGAHGDEKGNPDFPEYAVVTGFPVNSQISSLLEQDIYENHYIDFLTNNINFFAGMKILDEDFYLATYMEELLKKSYEVSGIDLISVRELSDIVYSVSGNRLPLKEWVETNWEKVDDKEHELNYYIVGSIKDYLPNGYEWLYGTTYWTKTGKPDYDSEGSFYDNTANIYFVDTLGNLCNTFACWISVGAGLRPVVEISKESINYNLTTKSDNGGTLETDKSYVVGDTIVLNATPKTGYKLEKLIVTTASGTTIEVSGKDIVENEDGTISINPEVFTMPLENVVVEAKWAFVNPKTGVSSFIGVMFTLLLIGISGFFMIKNYNNSYEL